MMDDLLKPNQLHHPELVSGSISPISLTVIAARWMLKQVQHDEDSEKPLLFRGGVGVGPVVDSALCRYSPPSIPPLKWREVL